MVVTVGILLILGIAGFFKVDKFRYRHTALLFRRDEEGKMTVASPRKYRKRLRPDGGEEMVLKGAKAAQLSPPSTYVTYINAFIGGMRQLVLGVQEESGKIQWIKPTANIKGSLEGISLPERIGVYYRLKRAASRELEGSWLKKNALNLAVLSILGIIIISGMVFWKDFMQPNLAMADKNAEIAKWNHETTKWIVGSTTGRQDLGTPDTPMQREAPG